MAASLPPCKRCRWPMNFKQFRSPSNDHRRFGSRGKRLQSKLGRVISLKRLDYLLTMTRQGRSQAV